MGGRWNPLIATTAVDASDLLARALAQEPRLTRLGVGVLNAEYKQASSIAREIADEQDVLSAGLEQIAACADWLRCQRWLNTFTPQTSYRRRLDVEIWFQLRGHPIAVSNGSFIAAALGLGIEGKLVGAGPNMIFKLAEGPTSVAAWERARASGAQLDGEP